MVRNDGSPDRKKYLGILTTCERKINPLIQEEYDLHTDEYVDCIKKAYNKNIAQKYIKKYLAEQTIEYKEYHISGFVPSHVILNSKFIIELGKPISIINLLFKMTCDDTNPLICIYKFVGT